MNRILIALAISTAPLCAQGPQLLGGSYATPYTVGTLPVASGVSGYTYLVTDYLTSCNSGGGGGTLKVWCRSNGTTYDSVGSAGGLGAANVTATTAGPATSLSINITSLGLTSGQLGSLLVECWSGTTTLTPVASLTLTGVTTTNVTANFTSASNVTCRANSNGGSGPAGAPGFAPVTALGNSCSFGDLAFLTCGTAGLYYCSAAPSTWTAVGTTTVHSCALSWGALTSGQWTTLTSAQWAAMTI